MASKDLEFHVDSHGRRTKVFKSWGEASAWALMVSATEGRPVNVDVVAWTRRAAVSWSGEDGGEQYDEDPEASVFERIEVRAVSHGRIP